MQLVLAAVVDRADAGVDEHLETVDAGRVSHVDIGVADRDAVLGRLRDRVNLGVDGAPTVLLDLAVGRARFIDEASDLVAMRHPGRRPIVAGREDAAVAHDHRAHLGPQAGRALGDLPRDRHEILIPARPLLPAAHQSPLSRTEAGSGGGAGR